MFLRNRAPGFAFCTFLAAFLLLGSTAATARNVTVGCAGVAGAFDYTSLTDALAALDTGTGNGITVSGTCTETLEISGFPDLEIRGTPGATITYVGNQAIATSAANLHLRNLIIGPADLGVFVRTGSVDFTDCVIREARTVGLEVWPQAQASLTTTTIENNMRGIELTADAFLWISGPNFIRHNTIGIASDGGSIWIAGAGAEISNNTYGIRLRNRSYLKMNSPALLANNNIAIALTNSSAMLDPSYGGGQTLQSNGVSGDDDTATIIAEGNSHVDLFGAQLTNNHANAIVLRDNASIRLEQDTITGNSGNGIRLLSLSTARIYGGMTVSGNSDADLFCSLNSFAIGDRSGIARPACLTFTRSTEPRLE